jgi:hypothetical protein
VGLFAVAAKEWLPIPGFNAGGGHTPTVWLLPAALSVGLALVLLARSVRHGDVGQKVKK